MSNQLDRDRVCVRERMRNKKRQRCVRERCVRERCVRERERERECS